jgi:hypothetical protein
MAVTGACFGGPFVCLILTDWATSTDLLVVALGLFAYVSLCWRLRRVLELDTLVASLQRRTATVGTPTS